VSGTAVVTGATAGIGASFARQLAAEGYDLVLVARDEQRLASLAEELSTEYGGEVVPMPADLTTDAGCEVVEERLRSTRAPVDLLVNNAGMTLNTSFVRSTAADEARLLRVNVHAVMRLTLAVLPVMVARGEGGVINVSSVSSFAAMMPGSTYPASKAWVTAFSESLALSVRKRGVRVMALCPGYTRTEMHQRAGIDMSKVPARMWLDADEVVREALRDLRRGKVVSVPNWKYKATVFALRHLPRRVLQLAARDTRGRERS
jgi:short-subunit dehydrogenase